MKSASTSAAQLRLYIRVIVLTKSAHLSAMRFDPGILGPVTAQTYAIGPLKCSCYDCSAATSRGYTGSLRIKTDCSLLMVTASGSCHVQVLESRSERRCKYSSCNQQEIRPSRIANRSCDSGSAAQLLCVNDLEARGRSRTRASSGVRRTSVPVRSRSKAPVGFWRTLGMIF